MEKLTAEDAETKSTDLVSANIATLKELFPDLVDEGAGGAVVNVDVLKGLVGDKTTTDAEEKYGLNWHGKRHARQLALTPSTGTLRPCLEESLDWGATKNLMIEGDNLEVLKLLQKSYAGKVKMIYIDPPYNLGKDRIYKDSYGDAVANYLELTGQVEGEGERLSSNTEASGRFHTNWLNMIYPRLKVAKNLLRNDGVIFISIDEREYSSLRTICTEVFGEENHLGTIVWKNATDNNPTNIAIEHEYVLVMARTKEAVETEWKSGVSDIKELLVRVGEEFNAKYAGEDLASAYADWFREHKSELWPLDRYKYIDSGGVYTGSQSVHNPGREGYRYDVPHPETGRPCKQPLMGYRFPKETMEKLLSEDRILFGDDENKIVELKVYASEYREKLSSVFELDGRLGAYDLKSDFPKEGKVFKNPKPVRLLKAFFSFLLRQDGDIVFDFFAGSGVTGKAVMELNSEDSVSRRFCLVQLPEMLEENDQEQKFAAALCKSLGRPEILSEVTKERLRRAAATIKEENPDYDGDLGFRVFKLDSTNIREWEPDRANLAETLEDSVDHLKTDRTEEDILYELLLKLGLDLCIDIEEKEIADKIVHSIGAGTLLVCLSEKIAKDEVEPLALGIVEWHRELDPAGETQCVFRDAAFANDVAKSNLTAILDQHNLKNVRSL